MTTVVYMPEVLANVTEAAIATWSVAEGDSIAVGETLAEVETEKAVVDFAAEQEGIVAQLLVGPGQSVAVGAPIAILRAEGESGTDVEAAIAALGGAAPPPAAAAAPDAPARASASVPSVEDAPSRTPDSEQSGAAPAEPVAAPTNGEHRFASPLARRLARANGIATATITGSGPAGRIVRRDVERALAAAAQSAPPAAVQSASPVVAPTTSPLADESALVVTPQGLPPHDAVPHSRMRRTIARRLTESKSTIPHYYVSADCRVDELLALRTQINAGRDTKVSVNDFVLKAVARALLAVPDANVMWTDDALLSFDEVNISVAIATESGLLTPVIRNAGALSLDTISSTARSYAEAARENRIRPDMLEGGTFTVSNLGMFGVPEFSAILNPPQSGILAVGAAVEQPVVQDGKLAIASVLRVTLSADHRVIDGAVAARLVKKFQEYIEHPLTILV